MKIANEVEWKKWRDSNKDPYGGCVIRYAEKWADIMEKAMEDGAALEDIAENASHEADTEGITGFMYGCAVQVLATVWEHGEELRKWHNLQYQIKDEGEKANADGGVLNPSILTTE